VRSIIRDWPVTTFAVIVIALTALVMLAGLGRDTTPFGLVVVIPIAAIIAAWLVGGRSMVRGLFVRIARWRVPVRWYVVALGVPLLGTLAIVVAGIVTGQAETDAILGSLDSSVLVVPLVVLLPALFEEFAWRGYGVEVMLERGSGFAKATLGIGVVFTAIHLPLYLPGHLYEDLPMWPAVLTLLGYAVLLGWIYVGSGRSSLLAGIGHAALNGTVPLTRGLDEVWAWEARGIVFGLVGLAILALVLRGPLRGTVEGPRS
jgi:hypothetical protein